MTTPSPTAGRPRRDWMEIVATVLLSFAAVATAWSSYQATRWNGEQAKAAGRANAVRVQAARASGLANSQTQVDVATFIQWVDARATGDSELESFYVERFRDEFRPAFDAWLATDPLTNADAPPTPFAMDEYQLEASCRSRAARRRGGGSRRDGPTQHPAGRQLRARRRPVLGRPVLRRDEHEAHRAEARGR